MLRICIKYFNLKHPQNSDSGKKCQEEITLNKDSIDNPGTLISKLPLLFKN